MKKIWMLVTAIILLLCATVLLTLGVVSIFLESPGSAAESLPP